MTAEAEIEGSFPKLKGTAWRISSEQNSRYNCVAFAAGRTDRWWWPQPGGYWPEGLRSDLSLDCFRELFVSRFGFEQTDVRLLQPGFDRVAIFALDGKPKHAARQLVTGEWTSKLGAEHDIVHPLIAVEGALYGEVAIIFRRAISQDPEGRPGAEPLA